MKKSLLSSISLGVVAATMASVSFAACETPCFSLCAPPCCKELLSGLYLGGQVAYDSYRIHQSVQVPPAFADEILSSTAVRNAVGVAGGLFAGYGMTFYGPLYLGGELWANASNAGASKSTTVYFPDLDNVTSEIKGKWSWGVSVLPGYKISSGALLYSRLGYARHRLKSTATVNIGGASFSTSDNNWYSGFQYGLGLEAAVSGPWSVRTEFDHTFLGHNHSSVRSGGSGAKLSASDNQFSLGLVYHFC